MRRRGKVVIATMLVMGSAASFILVRPLPAHKFLESAEYVGAVMDNDYGWVSRYYIIRAGYDVARSMVKPEVYGIAQHADGTGDLIDGWQFGAGGEAVWVYSTTNPDLHVLPIHPSVIRRAGTGTIIVIARFESALRFKLRKLLHLRP